jgi:hypothetical protein
VRNVSSDAVYDFQFESRGLQSGGRHTVSLAAKRTLTSWSEVPLLPIRLANFLNDGHTSNS